MFVSSRSLLFAIIVFLAACSGASDFRAHKNFVDNVLLTDESLKSQFLHHNGFSLHYVEKGNPQKAILLWLHGTPGAWTEAGRLLTDRALLSEIKVISIDRPGWGASTSSGVKKNGDNSYVEFDTQNELITPLINQLKQQHPSVPLYLGGHSWGASLAPYIAAKNQHHVDGLILFAGAYFPELAQPRWYNHLSKIWPVSLMIGKSLRLANAEMFALPEGLKELSTYWQALENTPLIAVQGRKDTLVNPKNADRLSTTINSANRNAGKLSTAKAHIITEPDYGHLWHIQRPEVISTCIRATVTENYGLCHAALGTKP